jgi:hypothetical protein
MINNNLSKEITNMIVDKLKAQKKNRRAKKIQLEAFIRVVNSEREAM